MQPAPDMFVDGDFDNLRIDGASRAALLVNAMKDRRCVTFMYDDKIRVVEVHALGTSTKDGSFIMRGYQVAGHASRPLPQWTLFTVTKIDSLSRSTEISEAPREGYRQGDRQMAQIFAELIHHA